MTVAKHGPVGSMTMRAVMSRVAAELFEAAASLKTVQDASDGMTAACVSNERVMTLQRLDITEQTVRALAGIVESLSFVAPDDRELEAVAHFSTCPLASLADRLAGAAPAQSVAFELF